LGLEYAQNAFDKAYKVEDIEMMAPISVDLSSSYNVAGDFPKTVLVTNNVIRLIERMRREEEFFGRQYNPYSIVLANHGRALGSLGDFDLGEAYCAKALRFAREIGNLYNVGWAELMFGWVYNAKGDGQNAVQHAKIAVKYMEDAQVPLLIGAACSALGWGHYFLGDLENCRRQAEKAIEITNKTGISLYLSLAHWLIGLVSIHLGDPENAQMCIERSLKLAQENNEKWVRGLAMIWIGKSLREADISQNQAAESSILQGIEILKEIKSRPYISMGYLLLGEHYVDIGHMDKALENLKKAEGMFQEMGIDYWLVKAQSLLKSLQG
jgi:tetratricopeptide (TPR) repeat protein